MDKIYDNIQQSTIFQKSTNHWQFILLLEKETDMANCGATYQKQGMAMDGKTVHVITNIKLASCYLKILHQILLRCISNVIFILSNPMSKPSAMPSWHCAACPSSFLFLFCQLEASASQRTSMKKLLVSTRQMFWQPSAIIRFESYATAQGFHFLEWSSQICRPESLHWIIRY